MLLAKRGGESLSHHTRSVCKAARILWDAHGDAVCKAFRVTPSERLSRILVLSAFIHDLGKAGTPFQECVRSNVKQSIRHEALSVYIAKKYLQGWLRQVFDEHDIQLAMAAAAGHHRKFPSCPDRGNMYLLIGDPDFHKTLQVGADLLGLPKPPKLRSVKINAYAARPELLKKDLEGLDPVEASVVKCMLIIADIAGSADGKPLSQGVNYSMHDLSHTPPQNTANEVVADKRLYPFQQETENSRSKTTLVTAGTGSGKTLAAYAWARKHRGPLWLTYPTTTTATDGFLSYLHRAIDGKTNAGRLIHSRAHVDYTHFDLYDEENDASSILDELHVAQEPTIKCTVDTVLGLLGFQRRGILSLVSFARSCFVFDEIHSYDSRLFNKLLYFLRLDVPVLLMTASLQPERLRVLRETVRQHREEELCEIAGPPEPESAPRYYRSNECPYKATQKAREEGKKVLWVVNTVARCQQVARQVKADVIFHSRFRYIDRIRKHAELKELFSRPGGRIVVTTQVAEMSLDISSDLLITDICPVTALIQRLGRLNRVSLPSIAKPFIVVDVEMPLPYTEDELTQAWSWLAALSGDLSQQDLALTLEGELDQCSPPAFFAGSYETKPEPTREEGYTIPVVLAEDQESIEEGSLSPAEVIIPMIMPKDLCLPKERYYFVASNADIVYDREYGAQWI